jgi:hypothetical protein
MKINQIIIVENKLNELAPPSGNNGDDEMAILKYYAGLWWNGNDATRQYVEKTLAKMGWEIGEDEGGYDNGGVFVVQPGDENGKSYESWPHEELVMDEGYDKQEPVWRDTSDEWADKQEPGWRDTSDEWADKQEPVWRDTSDEWADKQEHEQGVAEAFPSGQKDPWEKYEFHHEGKKLGHIYSSNEQAPFKTRRKVGKYIKQMHHATRADAEKHLISKHKETMQDVEEGENWSKHNNPRAGGMSKKSVSSYRRSHPGSKIQTAVTTKPSKLKKGSKSAKRRASFCARMRGMKKHRTGAKTARDPNSNINKSLRRWHCESVEELHQLLMIAEQKINEAKNLKQQAAIAISKKNSIKEGKPEEKEADYGDDYQDMVKRVGQKAKQQELAKKKKEEKPKELDESTEQLNKIIKLSGYKK